MTAHPNAPILTQLAEIAKTDPQPWKRLQKQAEGGVDWLDCTEYTTLLNPDVILRIKPVTVNIGGVELEGPLHDAPEENTRLWLLFDPTDTPGTPAIFTKRRPGHICWLNERRLFASKEARDRYQDALVKLANGETK